MLYGYAMGLCCMATFPGFALWLYGYTLRICFRAMLFSRAMVFLRGFLQGYVFPIDRVVPFSSRAVLFNRAICS